MASVQHQDWGIFEQSSCDGYALAFLYGEAAALLAHLGFITFWQPADEGMSVFLRASYKLRFLRPRISCQAAAATMAIPVSSRMTLILIPISGVPRNRSM